MEVRDARSFEEHVKARTPNVEHKLSHIRVEPATNGFVAEHHMREGRGPNGEYIPPPEPKRYVFNSVDEIAAHVYQTLGGKAKNLAGGGE